MATSVPEPTPTPLETGFEIVGPEEEIVDDYMLTKACSQQRFEMIRQNFPEVDLNIAIPRPSYMTDFIRLFRSRFGGIEGYFSWLGLSPEEQKSLREKLLP